MSVFQAYPTTAPAMQPVTKIRIFRFRLAAVLLAVYWLAMFTGTHLPRVDFVDLQLNDKVKHACGFFGLTLLLCYVSGGKQLLIRFLRVAAIVLLYAGFDEWSQGFIPGRTPDRWDFLADAAGMLLAMAAYLFARQFFNEPVMALVRWIRSRLEPTGEPS